MKTLDELHAEATAHLHNTYSYAAKVPAPSRKRRGPRWPLTLGPAPGPCTPLPPARPLAEIEAAFQAPLKVADHAHFEWLKHEVWVVTAHLRELMSAVEKGDKDALQETMARLRAVHPDTRSAAYAQKVRRAHFNASTGESKATPYHLTLTRD